VTTIERRRLLLGLGLLGSLLLLYFHRTAERVPTASVGGIPYRVALAQTAEAGAGREELAFDGRRNGKSAHAFRHGAAAPKLSVDLAYERELRGVVVSWHGAAPKSGSVTVEGKSHALLGSAAGTESWTFLRTPQLTRALTISYDPGPDCQGIAEVGLIDEGAPLWLVAPRARADLDAAVLSAYGVPSVARVPAEALAALAQSGILRGDERWVVSNAPLESGQREQLRSRVTAGGFSVELGPLSSICDDRPVVDNDPESVLRWNLRGAGLDGARLIGPIARAPGCTEPGCAQDEVISTASSPTNADENRTLISQRTFGKGACVRFFADVSRAMVRLRQGNPQRHAAPPASEGIFKPGDLFVGDLEPADYAVPSADRLGFAITAMITRAPGPDLLLHSLPSGIDGLVVYTLDQDYVPAAGLLALSQEAGAVGLTVTLTNASLGGKADVVFEQSPVALIPEEIASELATRGHELGIHPNLVDVKPSQYREVLAASAASFGEAYGVAPRVVRNHHLVWQGVVDMAEELEAAGLALDLNFVTAAHERGYVPGYMTASALPLPFVNAEGQLLAIMQQGTQLDDYVLAAKGEADEVSVKHLIAHAERLALLAAGEHLPLTVLHHPAWWFETKGAFQRALFASAKSRRLEVWGAGRWLRFVEESRAAVIGRKNGQYTVRANGDQLAVLLDDDLARTSLRSGAERKLARGGETFALVAAAAGFNIPAEANR